MKNKIVYPDYDNSILGIPNSILKYCGVEPLNKTNKILDKALEKGYKNVVVMLFDGMGMDCLENNLPKEDSIFHSNIKQNLSSTFLCTTTAATTSMRTALSPIEHGWLGWSCYFKEIDKLVNIFINTDGTKKDFVPVADYNVAEKYIPKREIFNIINEEGNGTNACSVSKFGMIRINDLDDLFNTTESLCNDDEKRFIYTYWGEPDHMMHENGCYVQAIKDIVADIQNRVAKLKEKLEDTLIIVTADHGLIDSTVKVLDRYPHLTECLRHPTGLEPRCNSFYIKDGMIDIFKQRFIREFGDKFILLDRDEILNKKIMGEGIAHPKSLDFIGDVLAVAVDDIALWHDNGAEDIFKALHAGLTEQEMRVPMILIEG
jgi:predicted AlkP superfamily pyrophosphatase or phosphodiesterase